MSFSFSARAQTWTLSILHSDPSIRSVLDVGVLDVGVLFSSCLLLDMFSEIGLSSIASRAGASTARLRGPAGKLVEVSRLAVVSALCSSEICKFW